MWECQSQVDLNINSNLFSEFLPFYRSIGTFKTSLNSYVVRVLDNERKPTLPIPLS